MTGTEAKVRVRLDTSQAKRTLADLSNSGAAAAKKLGGVLSSGVKAVGLGVGIGAGIEALKSPTISSITDTFGEALGGLGAQLEYWALGDLAPESRAAKRARDELHSTFGTLIGLGGVTPQATNFFEQTKAYAMVQEQGRQRIEMDERFRGPGIDDIMTRVGTLIGGLLDEAVTKFAAALRAQFWF